MSIRRVSSRQGIGTRGGGIVTKDSTGRKKFTNFYLEFLAGCWNTVQTIRIPSKVSLVNTLYPTDNFLINAT